MPGLLADENCEGHLAVLVRICQSARWSGVWEWLGVGAFTFDDVKLTRGISDSELWQYCQEHELLLLTNNRNEDDAESLQATIKARNEPSSLPVLTIAAAERLRSDPVYAERAAIKLMELLLDIELVRGSGRVFLP
jgi:hypothetical protein